ncbi:MAG: GNAT family N-acetyltransferase [Pseudomonadota bacterium]
MTDDCLVEPVGSADFLNNIHPWAVYQEPEFLDLFASHYGWQRTEWSGVPGLQRTLPGLGALRARTWNPEMKRDDWYSALLAARTGYVDVMSNRPVDHPGIRCISPADLVSMLVDLRGGADAILAAFESRARKAVRHAQREGLGIDVAGHAADIERLHRVLHRVSGDGRIYEVPPLALLQALHEGGLARAYLAIHSGEVVGGAFVVGQSVAHGLVSGFDAQACGGLPGTLLYLETMSAESRLGRKAFDLGAQSPSALPGLAFAKRAYGPRYLPAYRYIVEPEGMRSAATRALLALRGHKP